MPDIQGYPSGFLASISVPEIYAKIESLNGQEVENEGIFNFSIGIYRPQKDYCINLTTVSETDRFQVSKEIYIPITKAKSVYFYDEQTVVIELYSNDGDIDDDKKAKLTHMKLKSENQFQLCKIFACFEEQKIKTEPAWMQGIETLTLNLRSCLQKLENPENESSFIRIKVDINKDTVNDGNNNDICNFITKLQRHNPQKLCLNFGKFEPNFGFIKALSGFEGLEETEMSGIGFKTAAVVGFLKKFKKFKKIKSLIFASNHPELKEKDLNTQAVIQFCPANVTSLGLLFYEQIPHTIEYLQNLEHLFVSIHNLFSYRLFTLPKLKTINVSRINSYKQNFFPATALKYKIDRNLINTGFYALDTVYHIEKSWTPKIPSLFELAAGSWYTNREIQKTQIPDVIQKRLFYGRIDFQMCTKCNKIFNDKLFSAWIIRQKDGSERQYFKHKFCFSCFTADRENNSNCDMVVSRNNC